MSAKNLDKQGRWRSVNVSFRVSPEEDELLETFVKLSGMTKQDYITSRLLCKDVVVQGNPRVYKALRDKYEEVIEELKRIEKGGDVRPELLETIEFMSIIMNGMNSEKEKTTALIPSVGADGEQSNVERNNSIPDCIKEINEEDEISVEEMEKLYREALRKNDPAYLHTVSLGELYETVYHSRPSVIDGLLCAGAYILAGAPKIGKSFLVAQIAYHVSTGQKLWEYDVRQGTVLYLALEDDYQRLQERMFRMFGIGDVDSLYFATNAKQLGNGLDEQLELFVKEHEHTKLIIVDTLQKVREVGGDSYSYANDYEIISKLKKFADNHGICVLIVHHTRKQPAGDNFEMISGTTGLLGCADGALLMQKEKRTDGRATLDIVGRDQPDQKLHLVKDQERLIWTLDHAEAEMWKIPPDPTLEAVARLVSADNREWTGSPSELAETINNGMAANTLTKHLNVNASRLMDEYNIRYENKPKHSGRKITLTYMVVDVVIM